MNAPEASIRVRRGVVEIEVTGTEEFCRKQSEKLFGEYMRDAGTVSPDEQLVERRPKREPDSRDLRSPRSYTFRDMLNKAVGATAAEKLLMAGYFLADTKGQTSFDAVAAAQVFDQVYEALPNFSREFEKAAKAGWLVKTDSEDGKRNSFEFSKSGWLKVQSLVDQEAD